MTPAEELELYELQQEESRFRARDDLTWYARQAGGVEPAKHHLLLIHGLHQIEAGLIDVLLVMMPPGSAKSSYGSVIFPSWYLGRHPERCIIAASHTQELADRFGRRVRNLYSGVEHSKIFKGSGVAPDSSAMGRWDTLAGGEYFAAGIGGSITGRRADLAIIDDPVKSREDADSETVREKQWAWWRDDLMTRLKPNAGILLIMCMTGDTPVLLADGSEKPLRDVATGDVVATYRSGQVGASKVLNTTSNGADSVYGIRTMSGTIVRANARHPFLTCDKGVPTWKRVQDLLPGDSIYRVKKGSGRVLSAAGKGVKSPLNAVVSALRTTIKLDGLKVPDPLRATVIRGELHESSTGTAWIFTNTTRCLKSSRVVAQSVESFLRKMFAPIGVESYALIIATKVERFVDCCATTVTWLSGTLKRSLLRLLPQSTSDFILDQIVEITPAGEAEVFDIQVEGDENFIANGLVSHNTRWHEDDLGGRVLEDLKGSGLRVRTICVPMEAMEGDELGRQPGELLWPEWYTQQMVENAKREPRTWTALYQQQPRPIGGGELKLEWLNRWQLPPRTANRVVLVDPASGKYKTRGDFTSMWVVGVGADGNEYVLDGVRDRLNLTERTEALFDLVRRWTPAAVGYEQYGLQADVEHIRGEQERQQYRFRIIELGGTTKKEDRIRRLIPGFQMGRVWMPAQLLKRTHDGRHRDVMKDFEDEYSSFPVGAHDDSIDCLARKEDEAIKRILKPPAPESKLQVIPGYRPSVPGMGI